MYCLEWLSMLFRQVSSFTKQWLFFSSGVDDEKYVGGKVVIVPG
jgi:hypothetical protein